MENPEGGQEMPCAQCGKTNDDTARFCRFCGSTLTAASGRDGSIERRDPPPPKIVAVGKSPVAALIFAVVFPGLGQFYNGDFKRGLLIVILASVCAGLALETAAIPLLAVWLWGVVNAYSVAARKTRLWT
jgi:TM2 domain-containing membrane protein YozV